MTPRMFRVRLLRSATFGARRMLAGAELDLDAGTAAELLRNGCARLVDGADLAPLIDTVQADHGGRWPKTVTQR